LLGYLSNRDAIKKRMKNQPLATIWGIFRWVKMATLGEKLPAAN
jgi:hypothetical protein